MRDGYAARTAVCARAVRHGAGTRARQTRASSGRAHAPCARARDCAGWFAVRLRPCARRQYRHVPPSIVSHVYRVDCYAQLLCHAPCGWCVSRCDEFGMSDCAHLDTALAHRARARNAAHARAVGLRASVTGYGAHHARTVETRCARDADDVSMRAPRRCGCGQSTRMRMDILAALL